MYEIQERNVSLISAPAPRSYSICLFLLSAIFTETPFYHYSSSEGLASSSVYDLIQDSNGYMWFATANGVSKFDGHNFTNYSTADGLNTGSIISLMEGQNGEIYFGNIEKGFNVYSRDKIENYSDQSFQNIVMKGMFTVQDQLYSYSKNNITGVNPDNTMNLFKGYLKDFNINK
ncbi:MAG: hypothetical protein IPM38_14970 [Ignavibacteria bacterium]|nr:hypothetical protein [Ignavibacteria bacterium]